MVVYNLTNLQNLSSLNALVSVTNDATNGLLVGLLLLVVWLVILIPNLKFDFVRALASSSMVCFVLSLFLVYLGYLNILYCLAFFILTAIAGFILYMQD